jgi:hypothetical protein
MIMFRKFALGLVAAASLGAAALAPTAARRSHSASVAAGAVAGITTTSA